MDPTIEIVVPEGMLKAVVHAAMRVGLSYHNIPIILEEALRWITEDPIVPSESQSQTLAAASRTNAAKSEVAEVAAVVWQTIMFLAPEPEMLPSDIIDLIHGKNEWGPSDVLEAYRRGQKAGKS